MSFEKDFIAIFHIVLYCLLIIRIWYLKAEGLKLKDYFVKALGHDLRVPIIAQIRGLDILQQSKLISDSNKNLICEINKSCKYTLEMVSMLINTYQSDVNNKILQFKAFDISKFIQDILKYNEEQIFEKNLKIRLETYGKNVIADRESLIKALQILLKTVILYTKLNSTITIKFSSENNFFKFEILYYGNSLSKEEQKLMISNKSNFSTVGHVINMSLCKKIIEAYKGKLKFKSLPNNQHSLELCINKIHKLTYMNSIKKILFPRITVFFNTIRLNSKLNLKIYKY